MIRILGDRVLVALPPDEAEHVTDSGLVLVRDPELRTKTRGIVVAVGEKTGTVSLEDVLCVADERDTVDEVLEAIKRLQPAPFDVQVGDCVLFPASAMAEEVSLNGVDYVILSESEIIGVLEPNQSEAA